MENTESDVYVIAWQSKQQIQNRLNFIRPTPW
jgi:hypothetical protein